MNKDKLFKKMIGEDYTTETDRQIDFCNDSILQGDVLTAIERCINSLSWQVTEGTTKLLHKEKERILHEVALGFHFDASLNETELLISCPHCKKNIHTSDILEQEEKNKKFNKSFK